MPPRGGISEFAVNAAGGARKEVQCLKRLPENFFGKPLKVVIVVAAAAAQCKCDRKARAAPSGTPDALLIVEAHRRHICHHDGQADRTRSLLRQERRFMINALKLAAANAEGILALHFDRFYQNPKDAFSIFRGLLQLPGVVRAAGPDHVEVLRQPPDSTKWL